MFIDDVANDVVKNWEKTCSEKLYLKKSEKKSTQERKDNNPSSNIKNEDNSDFSQKAYNISDQKLNDTWNKLSKDLRKRLLPAQREWIKSKSICNGNWGCLTDMTDKRTLELEAENASQ
ncbi:lysozyme inhibitor LprI family protein [Klebsiella michiganensis]